MPKHFQSQVVAFDVQHIRDQPGGGRFYHDVESAHFHLQQLRGRRVRPGQGLVPGVRGGGRLHGLSAGHHQRVHRIRQIQVSPTQNAQSANNKSFSQMHHRPAGRQSWSAAGNHVSGADLALGDALESLPALRDLGQICAR